MTGSAGLAALARRLRRAPAFVRCALTAKTSRLPTWAPLLRCGAAGAMGSSQALSHRAKPGPVARHARPRGSERLCTTPAAREKERTATMAGQKIRIRLKAYDHEVVDSSARKIVETVTRTGAQVAGPVPLPTEINRYCVIRSPHKYKDSREHFEMRTH